MLAASVLVPGGADAAAVKMGQSARSLELMAKLEALRGAPSLAKSSADQRRRIALVIGNDAYTGLEPLNKAVNDAETMMQTVRVLGFETIFFPNLALDAFDDALNAFYRSIRAGDIVIFFYAGHGVAADGTNWLLPVDMPELKAGENLRLDRRAINANDIVVSIKERGAELAFVVLDACRDDPFPQADSRSVVRFKGLTRMSADQTSFIIYSAGSGQTALDRLDDGDENQNSVFTRKFLPILSTPGLPVAEIARRTRVEVRELAATVEHEQTPSFYTEIDDDRFYFQPPQPRLFGLAIGVDEYNRVGRLKGAVNDARSVATALRNAGATEALEILDRDARPAFIDLAWRGLVQRARPGDTLVFAYAGASSQTPAPVGSKEADGDDEYLALADADWDALLRKEAPRPDEIILDDQLTEWMELAAASNLNVILLVDGCYGGGLLDREFANISFIGASAEHEVVYEFNIEGKQHGAMSVAFAEAIEGRGDLNGDGFVSQAELFTYAGSAVYDMVHERQTPQFFPAIGAAERSLALFKTRLPAIQNPTVPLGTATR